MAPQIGAWVEEMLAAVRGRGGMDVVRDFAYPLPGTVICRKLGLPVEDLPRLKRCVRLLEAYPGRATSASCATRWSAPWRCAQAARSTGFERAGTFGLACLVKIAKKGPNPSRPLRGRPRVKRFILYSATLAA